MRLSATLCLLLGICLVVAGNCNFELDTNVTQIEDPRGLLNDRIVSHNLTCVDLLAYYSSVRSEPAPSALDTEIDTIGGLLSFKSLPMAFMAYWTGNDSWSYLNSDITSSLTAMSMAYTTLIELNAMGDIVRTFPLAKKMSNTSAGIDWHVSMEIDDSEQLRWLRMSSVVPMPPGMGQFELEIIWLLAAARGQVNLGKSDLSPRLLESVIRIREYPYANPTNYLSLRALAAHSSTDFTYTNGLVASGTGANSLSVRLSSTAQILSNPNAPFGTNLPISVSDWQPSSGLRNAVINSAIGSLLNTKFGLSWDVRVADITFLPNSINLLYTSSLGYRNNTDLDPAPSEIPNNSPVDDQISLAASYRPTIHHQHLFCIIALIMLALLG